MNAASPLVRVEDMVVEFRGRSGPVTAVRGVSFEVGREKLAIVGESGSGKSVTCRALLGLVPGHGQVRARAMRLFGAEFAHTAPSDPAWRTIRGRRIGLILQDPRYSLNPVLTVGTQMLEALSRRALKGAQAVQLGMELLEAVQLRDPKRVWRAFPHELSGGMGQRVMIAMMLAMEPELLIADEPTSALDVTVQAEILSLLDSIVSARGMSLIFVTHDLGLVERFCDRVLIMYAGQVVDHCRADAMSDSSHPYTQGLLACRPSLTRPRNPLPTLQRDPAWLEDARS